MSEPIVSYSQAMQDVFVRLLTDFSPNGYFLDIGCNHPEICNNTYALEQLGWTGLLLDCNADMIALCKANRKAKAELVDLRKSSIGILLRSNNALFTIDYISFDVDDATDFVLDCYPFDTYRFKIMTFEHDAYHKGPALRDKSRAVFAHNGYSRICSDVKHDQLAYEDWYVDASYFPAAKLEQFKADSVEHTEIFKGYEIQQLF